MQKPFQKALCLHMKRSGTSISELSQQTCVGQDVIKKLRRDEPYSTMLENGMAIAAFYGKSVESFLVDDAPSGDVAALGSLCALLTEDEAALLLAQVRGLLNARGKT